MRWLVVVCVSVASGIERAGPVVSRGRAAAKLNSATELETRGGSGHSHLSAFELTACIVADLCPHGMLPLAWAASRQGGTGMVFRRRPQELLIHIKGADPGTDRGVWGRVNVHSVAVRDGRREERGPVGGALLRLESRRTPRATLCAGCCVFYAAFAAVSGLS